MQSLERFAAHKLAELDARKLKRTLKEDWRLDGLWIERGGRRLLSFSCNDYLNLSHHPAVKEAAREAVSRYGAGAGASRLITGNNPLMTALEEQLARFKGTEAACVFGSGYLANTGIIPTLVQEGDLLLIDELAHSCLWAGSKLSGAHVEIFRHNGMAHVAQLLGDLRERYRNALVLTDGVFSMDGDLAPLDQLTALCEKHDAWLMSDDAHGLGVVGDGRGAAHAFPGARVPLQMGTLSKSAGSYGGYLCASQAVIDLIKTRARTLVYSTGLPPASAAAASAALEIIANDAELVAAPLKNARRFTAATQLPLAESPIVSIVLGEPQLALDAAARLEEQGFLVVPIRPPTVPEGTARLRIAFTAAHPEAEIDRLAACVRELVPVSA
jgi:8-amino-7-oxononanoate synthase